MLFFKKDFKLEDEKRKAAQKERERADTHYLDVIRTMRIQHEKDINELRRKLKNEYKAELKKIRQDYRKNIKNLQLELYQKDEQLRSSRKAWALIGTYVSDIMNLSTKIKIQSEINLKPILEQYQRVNRNEHECEMLLKKLNNDTPKIEKFLGIGDFTHEKDNY